MAETITVNYGWTKPEIGASVDNWGGYINADLDGIDTTVKSVSTVANAAYPASNPAGYITAAAIPAPYVLPTASTSVLGEVKVDGATINISGGGVISGTPSVTISDTAPSSPVLGALWFDSVGGQLYTWFSDANSSQWVIANNSGSAPQVIGDNRIINGDMRIDQRNNGAGGSGIQVFTVDRWKYNTAVAAKGTWNRAASGCPGFPYHLNFTSSSAYAAAAADFFMWMQPVEADMVSDFQWGTSGAQPVTVSFWAYVSQAGTYGGSIRNAVPDRSYVFTFVLTANTWTRVAVTIPGDTGGTWALSGNGVGLYLSFDLGSGSNYKTTANVWNASGAVGVTGGVNVVATNAAYFYLTGVKLEVGSVATPFNRQTMAKSLADCQRYWQRVAVYWSGNASTTLTYFASSSVPVPPRITAALTGVSTAANGFPAAAGGLSGGNPAASVVTDSRVCNATTTGGVFATQITLDAEL